eukprot:60491-Rhodomonas_salina.2
MLLPVATPPPFWPCSTSRRARSHSPSSSLTPPSCSITSPPPLYQPSDPPLLSRLNPRCITPQPPSLTTAPLLHIMISTRQRHCRIKGFPGAACTEQIAACV